jgi:hypothetical protein
MPEGNPDLPAAGCRLRIRGQQRTQQRFLVSGSRFLVDGKKEKPDSRTVADNPDTGFRQTVYNARRQERQL